MKKVEGAIASYGLQEWWLTAFTDDEREYIDSRYQPMGAAPHTLTQGPATSTTHPAPEFLNGLNTWFRSAQDASIAERIHRKLTDLAREHPVSGPGYYGGRHFTTYVRDVHELKKSARWNDAEQLLIELVAATEADARAHNRGIAPWYYEELAKIYRRQKAYSKEVAILERFAVQEHAPGVKPPKLLERLTKARKLAATSPGS